MNSIYVQGGVALQGKVRIQGSKNAALPILAACLLTEEPVRLENVPKISDVYGMLRILRSLGCKTKWENRALMIQTGDRETTRMPEDAAASMRSSLFLLGPLLAKRKKAELPMPGGCVIGKRPIDIHLKALQKMGVQFEKESGRLTAWTPNGLRGSEIRFDFPSVGATENLILAAVLSEGTTKLYGCAREPEVQVLCDFLNSCGARIKGIGKTILSIEGVDSLRGTFFRIPADRIVAGTYLFAGFATGGEILLEEFPVHHMGVCLSLAERMGASLTMTDRGVYAQYPKRAGALPFVRTDVYPGFPTDLQSVLLAVRCTGEGDTILQENIFENRFRVKDALASMGADIQTLDEKSVRVHGVRKLRGTRMEAYELRGGAALVVAALGANGESRIGGTRFIERGYENISRDFRELGARIVSG